jgi:hypothetical protein
LLRKREKGLLLPLRREVLGASRDASVKPRSFFSFSFSFSRSRPARRARSQVMGKKLERLEIEFAEDGSVSKEREQELKAQIRSSSMMR